MRHTHFGALQVPACGEVRLREWRQQLEALPDDATLQPGSLAAGPTPSLVENGPGAAL